MTVLELIAEMQPGIDQVLAHEGKSVLVNVHSVKALLDSHEAMREALVLAQRLHQEALPQFNWGESALDANAIHLLNEVPIAINRALSSLTEGECVGAETFNPFCEACGEMIWQKSDIVWTDDESSFHRSCYPKAGGLEKAK